MNYNHIKIPHPKSAILALLLCFLTTTVFAQQRPPFSDETVEGKDGVLLMPYTKGEVKQEIRFVNSPGLEKYSAAELDACKKSAANVASILADWLNNYHPQGFEARIITLMDFVYDATLNSQSSNPHPKVYAKIELHFAPLEHTSNGKYPNYAASSYVSIFLNGTDNSVAGASVAGNLYIKPRKTTDFFGADIYQTTNKEITIASRRNTSVFQPVSQEQYLQTAIREQQENKKNTGLPSRPPDKNERRKEIEQTYKELLKIDKNIAEETKKAALHELENESKNESLDFESKLQTELDQMPASERVKPAFYATDPDALTNLYGLTGNYSGLCPESHRNGCESLVRTNPDILGFSPSGKINLMFIQWNIIQESGENPDRPRFYASELKHNNVQQWNLAHLYQQGELWKAILDLANN
jgi:hypothetical protein